MSSHIRSSSRRLIGQHISVGEKVELNDEYMVKSNALHHIQTVIEAKFENAQTQYEEVIQRAEKKAQTILETANQEATRLIEEDGLAQKEAIQEAAYRTGYEEGFKKITEDCAEKINLSNQLLQQTQTMHQEWTEKSKHAFLDMAKALAEIILDDTLETHPEYLAKHLAHAQERLLTNLSTGHAVVYLHPESLQLLQDTIGEGEINAFTSLEFRNDNKYPKNRLYLDTRESIWDISPQTQLTQLIDSFKTSTPKKDHA